MAHLVCLIFLLSGAAALVFETLWFRQAGLALGNTVWASSIVLASFMAGLAVGNGLAARHGWKVRRPLLVYASAEAVVAVSGVAVTCALPGLGRLLAPLFGTLAEHGWVLNGTRLLVAFACLMVPATAMGLTLPVLTKALARAVPGFGESLGRLYGFNTLGAVAGALAAEAWLIGWLGIRGSALLASGWALAAGGSAALLARHLASDATSEPVPGRDASAAAPLPARARRLLLAALLCGAALLALEVLWVRFLALFVPSSGLVFAIVLAAVLAGIAAGSLLASTWLRWKPEAHRNLPAIAFVAGSATVLGYWLFDAQQEVARWLRWNLPLDNELGVAGLVSLRLTFPVAFLSGALFTLQGAALHARLGGHETRSAGLLTLANTVGAIAGAALAGLLLLPGLGLERSLFLVAAVYALAGLCLLDRTGLSRPGGVLAIGAGAGLALFLILFPFGSLDERFLPASLGARYYQGAGERHVATREALGATLQLLRTDFLGQPLSYRLVANGYSMAGNELSARRYMKLFVVLPVALHPAPKRALLIGYGVGQTAKALTDTAVVERIDIVDPSAATLELAARVFADPSEDPLRDPRVRVHHEDGRFFLQTTRERFDLITGEPPPPKVPGIVSLYTREHFQLMRDRLAEGGIVSYWLPGASLSGADTAAILSAFLEVFPDATLWHGWSYDLVMVGTRSRRDAPVSLAHFRRQWNDPEVAPELKALGLELPEQLGATFMADAAFLAERLAGVAPLTDDFPHRLSPHVVWSEEADAGLAPWLDDARAQRLFEASPWIAARWPPELRSATLPWFARQEVLRWASVLANVGRIARPQVLHPILTETTLEAPVLWLLLSDADKQRIARGIRGAVPAEVDYHTGAGALARRRYLDAAAAFRRAEEKDPDLGFLRLYRVYALCLAGRRAEARLLLQEAREHPGFDATDWEWLVTKFSLGS